MVLLCTDQGIVPQDYLRSPGLNLPMVNERHDMPFAILRMAILSAGVRVQSHVPSADGASP